MCLYSCLVQKYDSLQIHSTFPRQDICSIHHYLVCLLDGLDAQGRT